MRNRDLDRLFELLPAHVRAADSGEGGPLRALMALMAEELELVESDVDGLYLDWFIETCDDWVVPYIGDLVGARPLRPFGEGRGRLRAHVANTLRLRQAKGTLSALEQAARDVTGWHVHGVEFFRRMIRSQHVNHVRTSDHAYVSLHDAERAAAVGGPFEQACHNVDVRSVELGRGRYNLPSIGLFVWRLQAYAMGRTFEGATGYLGGVMAREVGTGLFTFDPVGRDLPLFNRPSTEASVASIATVRNVPSRLRTRPLYLELEARRGQGVPHTDYFAALPPLFVRLDDADVAPKDLYACDLSDVDDGAGGVTWNRPGRAGQVLFDPERGRLSLHPDDEQRRVEVGYAYGSPADLGGGPYDRRGSVETWLDSIASTPDGATLHTIGVSRRQPAPYAGVVSTLEEAFESWNANAGEGDRGIITVLDSGTYAEALPKLQLPAGSRLAVVAAGWLDGAPERLVPLDRRSLVVGSIAVEGAKGSALVLDGLMVEGDLVVEDGDLDELRVRHAMLGVGAKGLGGGVRVVKGNVSLSVLLASSICGVLTAPSIAGGVTVSCSILGEDPDPDSDATAMPIVLEVPASDLEIHACAVFGRLTGRSLRATDTIFIGSLDVARRQEGCVRYSFVPEGSRVPKRFECAPDKTLALEAERLDRDLTKAEERAVRARIRPHFTSRLSVHPGFAQLTPDCPIEIAEGGSEGAAMGAFHFLREPSRIANLRDAIEEFLPLGLEAGAIYAT